MVYLLNRWGIIVMFTHNRNIITDTVIQQFISLGITQEKHLCEMKSHEPQFRSKRIFESLKHEITATSLPQHWNDVLQQFLTLGRQILL